MYSNFKEQAIEYVKQAVQEDNAGNYVKAFPLYMNALEYFKTHLKYEKSPKIRVAISAKFSEYLRRAEEIRAVLDAGSAGPGNNGGDAAILRKGNDVAGLESDRKDSPACSSSDPAKSAVEEAPFPGHNFFKEQAIEYVKQAVQEDNAGNYGKAFALYMNALEYFKAYLKYEKNLKMKEAINAKFAEYLRRAQEVRAILDEDGAVSGTSSAAPEKPI